MQALFHDFEIITIRNDVSKQFLQKVILIQLKLLQALFHDSEIITAHTLRIKFAQFSKSLPDGLKFCIGIFEIFSFLSFFNFELFFYYGCVCACGKQWQHKRISGNAETDEEEVLCARR